MSFLHLKDHHARNVWHIFYFYTDGYKRFNRFKFRAKNGKTEKLIAEENNLYKIYDCGSDVFMLNME